LLHRAAHRRRSLTRQRRDVENIATTARLMGQEQLIEQDDPASEGSAKLTVHAPSKQPQA
jgi:hypothetical protein